MISSCHVSSVITYPVKSLQGISKEEFQVDEFGFENDRRFVFIDDGDNFISQRTHPKLALLSVRLLQTYEGGLESIEILSSHIGRLSFPLNSFFDKHCSGQVKLATILEAFQ